MQARAHAIICSSENRPHFAQKELYELKSGSGRGFPNYLQVSDHRRLMQSARLELNPIEFGHELECFADGKQHVEQQSLIP